MPTPPELLKKKRQIRDFLNKNIHDEATLNRVAEVINFKPEGKKEK